ncbi:MAG: hypothetical protein LBB19_02375 [Puniceicoccales bacterium]|jgi:hypothetical protein|nr:hypothetical protein [Puniceicoccales bacterium]
MKTTAPIKKSTFYACIGSLGTLLFHGCSPILNNLTPPTVQRNASNRYRFTVHSRLLEKQVVADSFKPSIVIDGETHALQKESFDAHFFFYDHTIHPQRTEADYYFSLTYDKNSRGRIRSKTTKSPLAKLIIQERCVFSLDTDRAPIGADVNVLGRGFTSGDRIVVGDCNAPTQCISENVLSFKVPLLVANKSYPVWLLSNEFKVFIGNLLLDNGTLSVDMDSIELESGKSIEVTFSTSQTVSGSGLYINVTTNIPDSVIMPEVIIPANEDHVTVQIEGGEVGQGHLFANAIGYDDLSIPIQVTAADTTKSTDSASEGADAKHPK